MNEWWIWSGVVGGGDNGRTTPPYSRICTIRGWVDLRMRLNIATRTLPPILSEELRETIDTGHNLNEYYSILPNLSRAMSFHTNISSNHQREVIITHTSSQTQRSKYIVSINQTIVHFLTNFRSLI